MARKKKPPEHENHERWLVSYADFITLLFAFFVVMYSISAVNQGKYRVLSDALVASFRSPFKSIDPIQIGNPAKSIYNPKVSFMNEPTAFNIPKLVPRNVTGTELTGEELRGEGGERTGIEGRGIEGLQVPDPQVEGQHRGVTANAGPIEKGFDRFMAPFPDAPPIPENPGTPTVTGSDIGGLPSDELGRPTALREAQALQAVRSIAEEVGEALEPLVEQGLVTVKSDEAALSVEIEIRDNVLFRSGSARVDADAVPVIDQLADVLKDFPYPIRVEGFTDTVPISTDRFPSNWELSAVRAASVVHVLSAAGIEPLRLSAVGYGEFRPVADNDTPEGRRKNRRVVLLVEANPVARDMLQARLPTTPRSHTFDQEALVLPPSTAEPAPEPSVSRPAETVEPLSLPPAGSGEAQTAEPAPAPAADTPSPPAETGGGSTETTPPVDAEPAAPRTGGGPAAGGLPDEPLDVTGRPGLERGEFPVIVLPEITEEMVENPVIGSESGTRVPDSEPAPEPPPLPKPPPRTPANGPSVIDLPAPVRGPLVAPIDIGPGASGGIPNPGGIRSIWPRSGAEDED